MTAPPLPSHEPSVALAALAGRLTVPVPAHCREAGLGQSLAHGAAGTALLHIERARNGDGTWSQAHAWISAAAREEISAADTVGLYFGAPAVAFAVQTAADAGGRYADALATLDIAVTELAHRRVDAAMARIRSGEPTTFREYDLFHGLTGIGAYLLRRFPGGSAMRRVLEYLVALTRPLRHRGLILPGWWVDHDPHERSSPVFAGGHANHGAAHGITGPLALLSQARRRHVTVDGHDEAIASVCAWLDAWRQPGDAGPWWPEHLTLHDVRAGRPAQRAPARPSWCYGTPGIARAGQLAAIATGDTRRQGDCETALLACLTDAEQTGRLTDGGLCHGWAGAYQTAWRAAHDSGRPALMALLPDLARSLTHHAAAVSGSGLLEGTTGTALALTTVHHGTAPRTGWDACLLID